jgi:hypothetical protein
MGDKKEVRGTRSVPGARRVPMHVWERVGREGRQLKGWLEHWLASDGRLGWPLWFWCVLQDAIFCDRAAHQADQPNLRM